VSSQYQSFGFVGSPRYRGAHVATLFALDVDKLSGQADFELSVRTTTAAGSGAMPAGCPQGPIMAELLRVKVTPEHLRWMKATIEAALKFGGEA
jgi:hypothetical protein